MSNVDDITHRIPDPPHVAPARPPVGVARAGCVLMASRRIAIVALIGVMIVWGSTFVITKAAIAGLPPLTLAFVRVTIGALVLLPFAQPRLRAADRLPWVWLWPMGFIGVALYYTVFNASLALTTAAQGALVQSSIPAVSAAIAILWLRERVSRMRLVGIALSVAGVLIVFAGGSRAGTVAPAPMLGNLFMFAAVLCWGVYTAMAKRVAQYDSIVITTFMSAIGALLLAPLAALELWRGGLPQPDLSAWLSTIYLGVFASGAAYLLYNYSFKHLAASQVGVFTNLVPIVGVLTGVALGEPLSWQAILGGAIVMVGVALTTRG